MKSIVYGTALALSLAFSAAAIAAGDGNSDSNTNNSGGGNAESPKKLKCKKNELIKTVKKDGKSVKMCVAKTAGIVPDEEIYVQARGLAEAGEYEWALTLFDLVQNKKDPRVLNYMGYSHRKAGRLETGISYYKQALAIDPNYVRVREYLGEGYVAAGRIDLATEQLVEISNRCGTSCEEYVDLKKAIDTAVNL
jgi:tetratricopeptide (TPR) repeat protein